jgi:formiminotetrahydrofolate cyclodeaminase
MSERSWREATLDQLVDALAAAGPVPAAGVAAAATCACAASLVMLAAGEGDADAAAAARLRRRALELLDDDERAYTALVEARGRGDQAELAARREASGPPLGIAEAAAGVLELAARARERAPAARRGDAAAAADLARGACLAAVALVETNLGGASGEEPQLARARELKQHVAGAGGSP